MDKVVSYACYVCKEKLSSRQTRHEIYCRVSSLESSFLCAEYSTPFSMGYEVTEREQPSYSCEECDIVFYSKASWRCHSYEHSNAWPYQCKRYGKGFG
ncbi:hypothetical protein AVEN_121827-1 [Araneus ventricosus]|uniref:C2H2-type domain-containing protein n=1 Tax=Araneus ventricosus TaxID=182803 RepID=A0A4Y2P1E7_ARAVE|nr:hypothetical protein AVEN_121827-1 [Araneus ventricosus]